MLHDWEREYPGRTESIFSSLRNVAPSHLADPAAFDFSKGISPRSSARAGERSAIDVPGDLF